MKVPAITHSIRVMHHMGGAHTLDTDEAGDISKPPRVKCQIIYVTTSTQVIIMFCARNLKQFHFVIHHLISRKEAI